jgi:hypothetical protein
VVYPAWWCGPEDDANDRVEMFRKNKKKFENDLQINNMHVNTNQSKEKILSNKIRKMTYGYQLKNDIVNRSDVRSKSPVVESKIRSDVIYDKYMHKSRERDRYLHRNGDLNLNGKANPIQTNYAISYDKNLKPESISEKVKNCDKHYDEEGQGFENANKPGIVKESSLRGFKSGRPNQPVRINAPYDSNENNPQSTLHIRNRSLPVEHPEADYANPDTRGGGKLHEDAGDAKDYLPNNSNNSKYSNKNANNDMIASKKSGNYNSADNDKENIDKRYNPIDQKGQVHPSANTSYGLGSVNPQTIQHNTSVNSNNFFVSDNDIDNVLNNPYNQYGKNSHSQRNMSEINDNFYNSERRDPSLVDTKRNDLMQSDTKNRKTNTIKDYKNQMIELLEKSKPSYNENNRPPKLINYFGDVNKKTDGKSISSKEQLSINTADFNRNSSEVNKEVSFKDDNEKLSSYIPSERNKGNIFLCRYFSKGSKE